MILLALACAFVTGGLFTWYFVGGHFATKAFEYQQEAVEWERRHLNAYASRDQAREAWQVWEARARDLGWSDSPKDTTFYERMFLKAPSNE